jgi:hypothetical protein
MSNFYPKSCGTEPMWRNLLHLFNKINNLFQTAESRGKTEYTPKLSSCSDRRSPTPSVERNSTFG